MNNMFLSIANKIINELKLFDIHAYIWHVANTGSVYIRFSDNRMSSIRISNHNGRSRLKYKYNLRSDLKLSEPKWMKDDNVWRYFLPLEKWKELIPILRQRHEQIQNLEPSKYSYFIPKYKQQQN